MALQLSLSHQSWPSSSSTSSDRIPLTHTRPLYRVGSCTGVGWKINRDKMRLKSGSGSGSGSGQVRASLEVGAEPDTGSLIGKVTEVNKDTFWPIVNASDSKPVIVDMYTQWCGPCKVIAPKYKELAEKYQDVVFLKLDCNQENKALAKELGIRVVPTFKVLKDGKIVDEVTGAKLENLVTAIEAARNS